MSNVKKLIIYAVVVVSSAIAVYFVYGHVQSSRYDPTAIPYLTEVLPRLSLWDVDVTREILDEETLSQVADNSLQQMVVSLSRIGSLQGFDRPRFKNKSRAMTTGAIERPVITYTIAAQYSSGEALVTMSLLDRDGELSLLQFNFQTHALAP